MTQAERTEAHHRFVAARAGAQRASYFLSGRKFIESSGTADLGKYMEPERSDAITLLHVPVVDYPDDPSVILVSHGYTSDSHALRMVIHSAIGNLNLDWHPSALSDFIEPSSIVNTEFLRAFEGLAKTTDWVAHSNVVVDPTEQSTSEFGSGRPEKRSGNLQAVIEYARSHGLQEVADQLVNLEQQPIDDEESPIQAESARYFVNYCIAKQKRGRPLMTVTPAGELDATWKSTKGERMLMRFFPNGLVWVRYKFLMASGSFETIAAHLTDPNLSLKIPDWA